MYSIFIKYEKFIRYRTEQYTNPGGSAQNTMRIMQWLCDETHESQISIFCGSLGNDQRSSILEKLIRLARVDTRLVIHIRSIINFTENITNLQSYTIIIVLLDTSYIRLCLLDYAFLLCTIHSAVSSLILVQLVYIRWMILKRLICN